MLGQASGELAPDRLEWTLVVRVADADPRAAFDACSARLKDVVRALGDAELSSSAVTVEAEWHTHGHKQTGRQIARGALTVVAPIADAGAVASAAMAAGADDLHGPRALLPDTSELLDDLYEQAVRAARRTAERMATAGGRTLGRMLSVRDPRADEADPYVARAVAASGTGDGEGPPVLARPRRLDVAVAAVFELTG